MSNETQNVSGVGFGEALRALVVLIADAREARLAKDKTAVRTEILLSQAGLEYRQIAELLGRKPDAVRMAIARFKKKNDAEGSDEK